MHKRDIPYLDFAITNVLFSGLNTYNIQIFLIHLLVKSSMNNMVWSLDVVVIKESWKVINKHFIVQVLQIGFII